MHKATGNGGAYMMKNPARNEGSHHASGNAPKGGQAVKVQPIEVPLIPVEELKEITDNFGTNALIGESSYGRVYYGVLKSREHAAIKKLDANKQPDEVSCTDGTYLAKNCKFITPSPSYRKICSSIQGSTTAKREICIPLFYYHSNFVCKFHYALGLKKMQ
ncbi:hypothetical protein ABKV19_018874 [Rosa sericea]